MDIYEKIKSQAYSTDNDSTDNAYWAYQEARRTGMNSEEAKRAYHKAQVDAFEAFKKDALEYTGWAGHPRAEKVFSFAYEEKHSYGYHEVVNMLEKLYSVFIG